MNAQQLADLAEQNPLEWQMHENAAVNGYDGIIYDATKDSWTVGSNGDYDIYTDKAKAVAALEWSWQQAEENAK